MLRWAFLAWLIERLGWRGESREPKWTCVRKAAGVTNPNKRIAEQEEARLDREFTRVCNCWKLIIETIGLFWLVNHVGKNERVKLYSVCAAFDRVPKNLKINWNSISIVVRLSFPANWRRSLSCGTNKRRWLDWPDLHNATRRDRRDQSLHRSRPSSPVERSWRKFTANCWMKWEISDHQIVPIVKFKVIFDSLHQSEQWNVSCHTVNG